MKLLKSISLAALFFVSVSAYADQFTLIKLDKRNGDIRQQIEKNLAVAQQRDQKVFVQIIAEWCRPCRALRASMSNALMKDAFSGTYILQLDVDQWGGDLKGLGVSVQSIPAFFGVDGSGNISSYTIHGGAWKEDIPENMAPALKKYFLNKP